MGQPELITSAGDRASLAERMAHFHVPGVSIALIRLGRVKWARSWGQADSEDMISLSDNHLLYACSMTKFVTAMTAVALAQAEAIDLDADVSTLLTSWQPEWEYRVTLRQLLSHQAGIVDGGDCFLPLKSGQDYPGLTQVLEGKTPVNTKALRIEQQPGSAFAYSDNGYCLAQLVLEDVTGTDLTQLADKYVFAPLGLKDSILNPAAPLETNRQFSSGHEPGGAVTPGRYPVYPFPAAAGLWCTTLDMAAVIIEVCAALKGKGRFLSRDSALAMVVPHNLPYAGLGNFSQGMDESRQIYHLGWGRGFQCAFLAWPWQGQGAVVMTNSQPGMPQNQALVGEIVRGLAREYNWGPVTGMLV